MPVEGIYSSLRHAERSITAQGSPFASGLEVSNDSTPKGLSPKGLPWCSSCGRPDLTPSSAQATPNPSPGPHSSFVHVWDVLIGETKRVFLEGKIKEGGKTLNNPLLKCFGHKGEGRRRRRPRRPRSRGSGHGSGHGGGQGQPAAGVLNEGGEGRKTNNTR